MAKKRIIFLAIAVLCSFTPWFSWLNYFFFVKYYNIFGYLESKAAT